ncbi:PQQ-dependent sugar dehydrogenase [Mucilaginibacter sp. JRF]|uniref:PQQ-dependent sugar dehydrogenase n=1 Tax=Mucilaginibacter sp. JRF TaxID=2780088 RepID=UPI001D16456C|nr:PQQ-dependent sugar dehydrogenase [Mucilaginibacter sp. JRF]
MTNFKQTFIYLCSSVALWGGSMQAQTTQKPDDNRFTKVILQPKLEEPMQFQILKDGSVLYVERKGKIKLYNNVTHKMDVIGEIPVSTEYVSKTGEHSEGEDGLQGIILDPDYDKNHWIYIYYSPTDAVVNRLSRFVWKGGKLDMSTEKKVLEVKVQREECCHVGGGMLFDKDRNLYLSTGDNTFSRSSDGFTPIDEQPGESPRDAQKSSSNTNDLRGKILRIHPEPDGSYTIPEGNLFAKGEAQTRPEIYTMGNRNPWRLTIDSKTGWLYWGEVGPDGSNSSDLRGPRSYDEFNVAKKAGNFGWPYFNGTEAYRYYDFATKKSGEWWNPAKPTNNSPNNTGLKVLPPTVNPLIWYPYAASDKFPDMGSGGRSAVGGPIFHADDFKNAKYQFPTYYEGKWLITDWVRGWILAVTLDDQGNYVSMERFLPDLTLRGPIDMKFGPDGSLYVLEYGNGYFKDNPEAELIKVEYNGGNRKPAVQASADKTAGAVPFMAKLSSKGTTDADGDKLTYKWNVTRNGVLVKTSTEANPQVVLAKPGKYRATLTVSDSHGASNSKSIDLSAGNAVPDVRFLFTKGNSSFFFPGKTVAYKVTVNDKEDGSLANKRIQPSQVSVSINYLSEGYDMTAIAQKQNNFDASAQFATAKMLLKKSDCYACHAVDAKSLGPSFTQVAIKYKGDKGAEDRLTKKVIAGGSGVWGDAMMPAHSSMPEAQVNAIVKYVLSLSEKKAAPKNMPVTGTYVTNEQPEQTNKGSFIFRAAYRDKGTKTASPQIGESIVVLRNPLMPVADADGFKGMDVDKAASVAKVIDAQAYIQLKNIDLTGIKTIKLRGDNINSFTIHSGSPTGKLLGEASNGQANIATTDKQDIYFVFSTKGGQVKSILFGD